VNPGIGEEAGQTARTFIDALKAQPATLALIVANIAMLVFMFYALAKAAEFRDGMLKGQFEYQKYVTDLLSKCVVPTDGRFRLQSDESVPIELPRPRPAEAPPP
jgi:hypothetical protein